MSTKKTFTINYLDDIFYEIKNDKNETFIINIIFHLLSLLLTAAGFILFIFKKFPEDSNLEPMYIVLFLTFIINLLVTILSLAARNKKMKKEIYDNKIQSYNASLIASSFLYLHFFEY